MKPAHSQYRLAILFLLPASLVYAAFVVAPVIELDTRSVQQLDDALHVIAYCYCGALETG